MQAGHRDTSNFPTRVYAPDSSKILSAPRNGFEFCTFFLSRSYLPPACRWAGLEAIVNHWSYNTVLINMGSRCSRDNHLLSDNSKLYASGIWRVHRQDEKSFPSWTMR